MADRRHIENRFLVISRRVIGRLARNSDRIWRITCSCWSCDQNGNFRQFTMADGRHFENSSISISEPWIIRFRWNLVQVPFRAWKFDQKNRNFSNSSRCTDAILKSIYRRLIDRLTRNSEWRWRITCRYRSRDHKWKFSKIHDGGRPPFWKQFSVLTSFL